MRKICLICIFIVIAVSMWSQENVSEKLPVPVSGETEEIETEKPGSVFPERSAVRLDEMVVTASRKEEYVFDVPYTADIITAGDISTGEMSRTVPEIFMQDPSILVQKTSNGQGSPYIRGFTGFRTLFLIDGIRLNNSVFRDGPNQYWNTVDPFSVSRLEIVKGPSSVLYGSDAIGGTVNAITKTREAGGAGFDWGGQCYMKFSSADNAHVTRAEFGGNQGETFSFLAGGSFKYFNDAVAGREVGIQPETGYNERDGDLKMEYFLNPDSKLVFAFQHVNVDDAWRTHKTIYGINWEGTTNGSEKKRILDQERNLAYVQYHTENLDSFADKISVSLSYHVQEEERFRVKSDNKSDLQGFEVDTLGFWAQVDSSTSAGLFTYGVEYYRDNVDSFKKSWDAAGVFTGYDIQGPVADDATYNLMGLYVQNKYSITKTLDMTTGLRYTSASVDTDKVKDPETGNPISLSDDFSNVCGSLRFLYKHSNEINSFYGVSQGFRAPNLSDLTRLDTARSNEIETPSPGLEPEYFTSLEIGMKTKFDKWSGTCSLFYTDIKDMIIRYPTGDIIGTDYEVQKANAGDGFVYGLELTGDYYLYNGWSLFGGCALQKGEASTYPTSDKEEEIEPLSRSMPASGFLGVKWQHPEKEYSVEATVRMADRADDLSTRDESDTNRIPPDGTPGYAVFGVSGEFRLRRDLVLGAAVENIGNKDYRIHGSGQNEPGTDFIISVKWDL